MQNDLSHFKPLDPGRVNGADPIELQYWCEQLHCTESQLTLALGKVGEHVAAVRQELDLHR